MEPNKISSGGVERPLTPITIIGRSRSRAILRISINGVPITFIRSTLTEPVSSPSSAVVKFASACSRRRALMSSAAPNPTATASLTKCSSITCSSVRSPSGAAMAIATRSAFTEHGEKSTGTSISGDLSIFQHHKITSSSWPDQRLFEEASNSRRPQRGRAGPQRGGSRSRSNLFAIEPVSEHVAQREASSRAQCHPQSSYFEMTLCLKCRLPYASRDSR